MDFKRYQENRAVSFMNLLKGGENNMQTKSRYEVIADLEAKKRDLINQKNSLNDLLKTKEKKLKDLNREVEDAEEDIKDYKNQMVERKETIAELIKSVEESLERFSKLQDKKL